jgi:hypothetical protein
MTDVHTVNETLLEEDLYGTCEWLLAIISSAAK